MKTIRNCIIALLAVTSLLLAGCGNNNDNSVYFALAATEQTNAKIVQDASYPKIGQVIDRGVSTTVLMEIENLVGSEPRKSAAKSKFRFPLANQVSPGFVAGKTVKKGSIMEKYSSAIIPTPPPLEKQAVPKTAYGLSLDPVTAFSVDALGRLTKQALMGMYSTQYSYVQDSTRLASASYSDLGKINFTYDALGRISSYGNDKTSITVTYNFTGRTESFSNFSASYDTHNNLVALTDGVDSGRIIRTYDIFGNETKTEYFLKFGTAAETKAFETVSSYGPSGVVSSTTRLLDMMILAKSSSLPVISSPTITVTTAYKGMEVVRKEWTYLDELGFVDTRIVEISGQTYEAGNLITYLENFIVPEASSYFTWWRQTWVTLVSGKENQ